MTLPNRFNPWPLPRRQQFISELLEHPGVETHSLEFQHRIQTLPVFTVSIELPLYRLGNGRTLARQQEYIAVHGLPSNFFSRDADSAEALLAQDHILRDMANDEGLLDFFRTKIQVEPLLLTKDGYVVNGNRRLCAMRMLLEEDPRRYAHFENVRVVFLPLCTEKEIDQLEAELQVQPDIKSRYSWVDTAMLLRERQRLHDWSDDELSRVHEILIGKVKELISMLDYADEYLMDRGHPQEYSRVIKHEYAFRELLKARRREHEEARRYLITRLVYIAIDAPAESGTRLYDLIPNIAENLDEIVKVVRESFGEDFTATDANEAPAQDETLDLLGGMAGESDSDHIAGEAVRLAEIIEDPTNHPVVRECVVDVVQSVKARERQRRSADSCLKQVQAAHTALRSALSCLSGDSNIRGIETQLHNIEEAIADLREEISHYAED